VPAKSLDAGVLRTAAPPQPKGPEPLQTPSIEGVALPLRRLYAWPMSGSMSTRAVVALEALEHLATQDLSTQETCEQVVDRITRAIEVDSFFAAATDPDTGLCLGAGMSYSMDSSVCHPFWEHEFLVPDFNKFADLAVGDPVADLRAATGGKLSRSPRYRVLNALSDLEDELRAVLHAGGRSWGNLQLNRFTGSKPFSAEDVEFLRAAAPLAGAALRRALLEEPAETDPRRGPGVVVLDEEGTILSATGEADAWLDELAAGWRRDDINLLMHPELMRMSLSTLSEQEAAGRRVRLRTRSGVWLVAHASPLGDSGNVALVIEPAKASEVAPIVVKAYGLTPREVEVTRLVSRGLSTDEIATTLFLSRHTIRDHLRAIFEKVGVSSRGELTSRLFAEHYHPQLDEAVALSHERVQARAEA